MIKQIIKNKYKIVINNKKRCKNLKKKFKE